MQYLQPMHLSFSTITIPLSNVATVKRVTIPAEIAHYNISRVNDVHVNVSGRDIGSVARDVERALEGIEFENGVAATIRGPVETMKSGMSLLWVGLFVAAILVYLMLMAQFRSFTDPLIIMLASDMVIGFHSLMPVIYLCFVFNVLLSSWVVGPQWNGSNVVGMSLLGSVVFFVVSNFACWVLFYPHTLGDLARCYTVAIPFFRNMLIGDLFYSFLLFGALALAQSRFPSTRLNAAVDSGMVH